MNNQKIETIKSLYSGAKAYTMFIVEERQHDNAKVDYILEDKYYNCARLGFITNIMLAIKEELVEKVSYHNFESLVFNNELEKSVKCIASKVSNGYKIDNYVFDTIPNLVATLRDKLAHGNYIICSNYKEITIILDDKGTTINIEIDKLAKFVTNAMISFIKKQNPKEFVRKNIMFSKIKNGDKPLLSKSEVRFVSKNAKRVTIKFKRKDGKDLTEKETERLEEYCDILKKDGSNENIEKIKKITMYTYDFTYERKPIANINYDLIADVLMSSYKNVKLERQLICIAFLIEKMIDDTNTLQEIMASINNLILLKAIYENKSVDMNYVSTKLDGKEIFNGIMELANAAITLFQTLFSYANDDVFKNDFEYQQTQSNGLDYGKLDLSKIKVLVYPTDKSPIDVYLEQKKKADREYANIQKNIAKVIENKNNAIKNNNQNAISNINQVLNTLKQTEQIKLQDKIKCDTEYNNACTYEQTNKKHLINRSIINGIRNCIAHGNYRIVHGKTVSDATLVFEDIHNKKLTFKAVVNPIDFINMIYENEWVVTEFLNNLTTQNTLTRQK